MATNHPNRGRAAGPGATPTPEQIRDARMAAGLSQREAADLVLGTMRGWQGWEVDEGAPDHRRMPPGVWLLFRVRVLVRAGKIDEALALMDAPGALLRPARAAVKAFETELNVHGCYPAIDKAMADLSVALRLLE